MNYADIKKYDTANAVGINTSVYFSGCKFNCNGCFNKIAQVFSYGKEYTKEIEDLIIEYVSDKNVKGLCLLGGEVFQQDLNKIYNLVKRVKFFTDKPIWVWSGYTWEQLIKDDFKLDILKYIDVLIDGRFELDKKDLNLRFRGSSNQRIIDVQKSLKQNRIIEFLY